MATKSSSKTSSKTSTKTTAKSSGSVTLSKSQEASARSQISKIQSGINDLAKSQGKSLRKTSSGGYEAVPISNDPIEKTVEKTKPNPLATPINTGVDTGLDAPSVNTAQPSPTTAKIQAPSLQQDVPYEQARANLASGGLQGNTLKMAEDSLASRYKQGLQTAQASGANPMDTAQARSMVAGAVPEAQAQDQLGAVMQYDSNFDSIFTNFDKFMEPPAQKKSLVQEYKAMSKSLGIDDINEDLIDAKKIIDGTEDDIRAEVTAAGGFATDSQVLAMSNARNKSVIKNYNELLATRDNAMQQLNTMMELTIADRKQAQDEFDRKIGYAFKVAEFKQRAVDNARSQNMNLLTKFGAEGVQAMIGGSPYEMALFEKSLGLASGGLSKLASTVTPEKQMLALEMEYKRAQINATNRSNQPKADETPTLSPEEQSQRSLDQLSFLRTTVKEAKDLSSASGASGISKFFGDKFVGDTKFRQLESKTNTLRTNVLTLMTDPDVKKFFGPQMSEGDVRLMTAAGTTLNPDNNSPKDMQNELTRLDNLLNRMETAVKNGAQSQQAQGSVITAPTGEQIIIRN